MENLTMIEQLDFILNFWISPTMDSEALKFIDTHHRLSDQYLDKIIRDGYIKQVITVRSDGGKTIDNIPTIEGKLFVANGGYKVQQRLLEANAKLTELKEREAIRNARFTLWGTWFAGVVGFLVLIWSIFLWFYPSYKSFFN